MLARRHLHFGFNGAFGFTLPHKTTNLFSDCISAVAMLSPLFFVVQFCRNQSRQRSHISIRLLRELIVNPEQVAIMPVIRWSAMAN